MIENAVAYFGSRILYPSVSVDEAAPALSRAALQRVAQNAVSTDEEKLAILARNFGYQMGKEIYRLYLEGKVKPRSVRRLFLAHLDGPGTARKVCAAVIGRIRAASRG